ncbi:MAG: hypothetical protein PHH11_07375 [Methylomonas sp.]|nr:hypothetical protein [Methylomonas sp.]
MSAALKRELVPILEAYGFTGTFPRYRRERPTSILFVTIFYDKSATAFCLEFGAHERGDKLTSWGELIPENGLMLEYVPFDQRARLQARCDGGSVAADWFAFGRLSDDAQFRDLAASVTRLLPQVEAWFELGTVGPNVSPNGR